MAFGALAALAACATKGPGGAPRSQVMTGAALGKVNGFRSGQGLGRLSGDNAVNRAALHQAEAMARRGKMTHGGNFKSRMARVGIKGGAAENIAVGQQETERAVQAWIDSAPHRRNILGPYSRAGVAVAYNPRSGNRPYWAMVLAK